MTVVAAESRQPALMPHLSPEAWIVLEAIGLALSTVFVANASSRIGFVVLAVAMAYLLATKRILQAITLFLILLILVDSRTEFLEPAKGLRLPAVGVLAVYSLTMAASRTVARPAIWFAPFVAVASLAAFRGGQTTLALSKTLSYYLVVIVAFQFGARVVTTWPGLTARIVNRVLVIVAWTGLALVLLGPTVALFGPNQRFRGIMGNPDGIGLLASLALPFQLALLDAAPPERQRGIKLGILAMVTSGIACLSRGALIGILLVPLTRWMMHGRWATRIAAAGIVILIAGGTYLTIQASDQIVGTRAGDLLRANTLATGGGRFLAWPFAVNYIREAPIIGRGFAFDELIFDEEHRDPGFSIGIGGHQGGVHNGYLALLLTTGFVGLVLFFGFLVAVVRSTRQFAAVAPLLAVAAWSSVVENWITGSLNSFTFLFFLEILLISRLSAASHGGEWRSVNKAVSNTATA
jgi:O-antigen ligase